jgi:hypothetical protein
MERKHTHLAFAAGSAGTLCIVLLLARGFIPLDAAVFSVIAAAVGTAIALLILKRKSAKTPVGGSDRIGLKHIYFGLGVVIVVRGRVRGWRNYDTVALIGLGVILTLIYVAEARLRKSREAHLRDDNHE